MTILLCHNYYQQPGGEDRVFADEVSLLESRGHEVLRFEVHNDSIPNRRGLGVARDTIWSRRTAAELGTLVRRRNVRVVHFHNTFPLVSPAAYYAARRNGAAVVQTLHNFRLLCPAATLLRKGKPCEKCVGKRVPWPALLHACYRGSRAATAVVASMLAAHRVAGTWTGAVDAYIALTEFARRKLIQGGLPAQRIIVKPSCVPTDPGPGAGRGGYAAFVGRLSDEKGVQTLLDAWRRLRGQTRLVIAGDGPLAARVREAAASDCRIEPLGWQAPEEVFRIIGEAACLVMPSICYEGLPRTLVEAFAKGTPVVASRLGGLAELVDDGRTGLHFEPGDGGDLAAKVGGLLSDAAALAEMRRAARREFQQHYTAEINYHRLMAIYDQALGVAATTGGARPEGPEESRPGSPGGEEAAAALVCLPEE